MCAYESKTSPPSKDEAVKFGPTSRAICEHNSTTKSPPNWTYSSVIQDFLTNDASELILKWNQRHYLTLTIFSTNWKMLVKN